MIDRILAPGWRAWRARYGDDANAPIEGRTYEGHIGTWDDGERLFLQLSTPLRNPSRVHLRLTPWVELRTRADLFALGETFPLGDDAFDAQFGITGGPRAAITSWFGPSLRAWWTASRGPRLAIGGQGASFDHLVALHPRIEVDAATLDHLRISLHTAAAAFEAVGWAKAGGGTIEGGMWAQVAATLGADRDAHGIVGQILGHPAFARPLPDGGLRIEVQLPPHDLQLALIRETSGMREWLATMADIIVGHDALDHHYRIYGPAEGRLKAALRDPSLSDAILALHTRLWTLTPSANGGASILAIEIPTRSADEITQAWALAERSIEQLARAGELG